MNQDIGCLKCRLNRVVFRTVRTMSPRERMQRYYEAVIVYPPAKLAMRQEIGANLQDAWKAGKRPNLRLIARAIAAP
ncbi:hypothetical protein [Stenotrophomonas sp. SY1]|uniref:hypothetical protein n=1 Tax=Stenotrophomonas sp. SY1 TaxID=477235 RepID=UPI001E29E351|nr:hypothetical protein [Stenotrophomonas sp. SY1]MCD9088844.1 hypothetical protein [Stenotrophomonas sp. SY1]